MEKYQTKETQRRKEIKIYLRRRKIDEREKKDRKSPKGIFQKLSITVYTSLITFLRKKKYINKKYIVKNHIAVPANFSFESCNDDSILFFKQIISTYLLSDIVMVIDFTNCTNIDISNAMLLDIILKELKIVESKYNSKYYRQVTKKVKYIKSKNLKTNKCLHIFKFIRLQPNEVDEEDAFLYLGLKKGWVNRISYRESNKGSICKDIREFVNSSLKESNAMLNAKGNNKLDNLLSEILNNADDHSVHKEWYVNGISYKEIINKEPIIELNLAILNFGFSIFEGIMQTSNKNIKTMEEINHWYENHIKLMQMRGATKFSKENLYTLYSLQEGISRLKYKEESRGRGTMNFIRAFIDLGSYGAINPECKSHLNIISGNTIINCDNEIAPYKDDNCYKLSLNKYNSIEKLPQKEYLKENNEYFPGTFLEVKIFLNKDFFKQILSH